MRNGARHRVLDDALWVVPGGPFVDVLPVAETADDAQALLISDSTDTLSGRLVQRWICAVG